MADWPKDVKTIAVITWDDSHSIGGWQGRHQWDDDFEHFDSTCVSVGYIAREDDRRIWLMQSLSACGSMAAGILIPKHAILERHEFEPGPLIEAAKSDDGPPPGMTRLTDDQRRVLLKARNGGGS